MAKKIEIAIPPGRLWPNTPSGAAIDIEVFGATGEYKSGKTLLGLSIAPGIHPEGHKFAGQPRTLYLDFEKSGGTYAGTGCRRIDVPATLMADKIDYTPLAVFQWFSRVVDKIEPGQYDVIVADPVTDIEGGLVEHVKRNCKQFGLTEDQVKKAGGLLWGAVKDFWKQVLLKLSTRCQCFFFTAHLRDVWQGNTPTGRREPKGKETLMELASLYLWLERKADAAGKVPDVPAAIVLKQRLADTSINAETGLLTITPLMPPRIPAASILAIRRYIAIPPDYQKLKNGERVAEQRLSDEERLRLELARAEADKDAEQARLARLDRQVQLQTEAKQAEAKRPQSADTTAARQYCKQRARNEEAEAARLAKEAEAKLVQMDAEGRRLVDTAPSEHRMAGQEPPATDANPDADKATRSQIMDVRSLCQQIPLSAERLKSLLAKVGAEKVSDLSREHCLLLIERLRKATAQKAGDGGQTASNVEMEKN